MNQSKVSEDPFVRIAPYHYVHIINTSTNITRLVLGPQSYVCLQDEKVIFGPEKMITLPPDSYCIIKNPVIKDASGNPVTDKVGQVKLKFGDTEYRFCQEPFPLYPGEKLKGSVAKLPVVAVNTGLRLRALVDFTAEDGCERIAGDEWIFRGPATYYPRKEVTIVKTEEAHEIYLNSALCLRAIKAFTDANGTARACGEQWLVFTVGSYLPEAYEEVVELRRAHILTDKVALHMQALETHTDKFGKQRRYGDEWLITRADTDSHICGISEEVVRVVQLTTILAHEYCVINNPIDEAGVPQIGKKKLVRGEKSFFLNPGEELECGIQSSYILHADDGLIIEAVEKFLDENYADGDNSDEPKEKKSKIMRYPGDRWMIRGPLEYVPPIEARVLSRRSLIPLDSNEGVYIRNTQTGDVYAVIGRAYMLNQDEELWTKKLSSDVIEILKANRDPLADRGLYRKQAEATEDGLDLTRVVTYQVPHNAAIQLYDYKEKVARVEFGPTLVMLGPHEQFTKLSLSGGSPKRTNQIKCLCLLLGPDFCTDVLVVETADHARLSLRLSYNWHFEVPPDRNQRDAAKLFSVPDFVGGACKAIAARVRGAVASVNFDDFHKNSARIIRASVFGVDETGTVREELVFAQNNLHITSVDVQSVEPVDQRTRDSLQKSVQLAIEITTNSQEAAARHEAERLEQEARGRLERQKIEDEAAAEEARRGLLETRVQLAALESTGQAKAEAQSRAEAARIEGQAAIEQAKLRAEALRIETEAELERLRQARAAELQYKSEMNSLKLKLKTEETQIEIERLSTLIRTLGADNIRQMASASSDHNLRMLKALGLQSTLITDGTTPVNLLSTAHGLIGSLMQSSQAPGVKPTQRPLRGDDEDEDGTN